MRVIICDNYDEMSEKAVQIVMAELKKKPDLVLGLATGSTTLGLYRGLVEAYRRDKVDFSRVRTFNLDEYYKISKNDPNSFWQEMKNNFFDGVNIKKGNINILKCENSEEDKVAEFCRAYEERIRDVGGIDLQILGIGRNGHIGFNEPGSFFSSRTRRVKLTASTIAANARHFKDKKKTPKEALTMGIGTIMEARKIILLANGREKSEAVAKAAEGEVTVDLPASVLQRHSDVTFILDKEAAVKIISPFPPTGDHPKGGGGSPSG